MCARPGTPTRFSPSEGGCAPLPNLPPWQCEPQDGRGLGPARPRRAHEQIAPAEPALEAADLALCRSALWEALALGFRPPTVETAARLASADGADALADAAAALDAAEGTALAPLARALGGRPAGPAALAGVYGRLFGHTARGGVTPYETEYGEDSLWAPPREMSDLGAFYRAFGLALRPDAHERPDHAACECEFLAFLARKEAWALEQDDEPLVEAARRTARLFLRDHVGRWVPAFAARLAREDPEGFYGALARLAGGFIAAECRRTGVALGPELLRLRSSEPDDLPMGCGPVGGGSSSLRER